jgi:hypothetical protein
MADGESLTRLQGFGKTVLVLGRLECGADTAPSAAWKLKLD